MRLSNVALLFALLGSACSNKGADRATETGTQATFVVDAVTAEVSDAASDPNFAAYANARLFHFRACLKDVGVLQPINGAVFAIYDGERKVDERGTDASGCLFWSERFDFSPTADETYLEANRVIQAVTVHRGKVTLPLVVNPWRKDADAFRDLRFQARPANLKANGASGTSASLLVDSISVNVSFGSGDSTRGQLELAFAPKLRRRAFDGQSIIEDLPEGKVALWMQFVALQGSQPKALTEVIDAPEVPFRGNVHWSGAPTWLSLPSRDSLIELRFEARPIGADAAVTPARGSVALGRLTGPVLAHDGALRAAEDLPFVESKAVANSEPGRAWAIQVGKVQAERVEVVAVDGLGKPKELEYQFLACIKNRLSLEPVLGERFRVTSVGASEEVASDSDAGCLRWHRKVEFQFASAPHPIRSEVEISGLGGYYQGVVERRVVYLLPWQASAGTSLIDEKFDGGPSPGAIADGTAPELLLTAASYKFQGRSFEVDSLLNLVGVRRYRFSLSPAIRRMTRDAGWLAPEPLQTGKFHVRFLLETDDLTDPQVVDAREVDAEAVGGVIQADVDFRFADLTQVMGRLRLSLDVRPVDASVVIAAPPWSDTVALLQDGSLSLAPRPGSLDARMALAPRAPAPAESSGVFAKSFALDPIPGDKAEAVAGADALAAGDEAALAGLCGLFYDPPGKISFFSSYRSCQKNPRAYLAIARTRHAVGVRSARVLGAPETLTLSMGAEYSVSLTNAKSNTESKSNSIEGSAGVSGEIPLLNLVGLHIGLGVRAGTAWTYATAKSRTSSASRTGAARLARTLSVDQITFALEGDVASCVTIAELGKPVGKRFFHCAPARSAQFRETYYFFYDAPAASGVQDPNAPASQRPFLALLRGSDRFESLVRSLQDANIVLQSDGVAIVPAALQQALPHGGFDGLFPGLLSP